jgi:acyl-CoA synthetase (AMP-forming)/AMP-acid ligase II
METIVDQVANQAAAVPDRPFLTEHGRTLDFAAFFTLTRRMAGFLAGLGLRSGDRVVLYVERRIPHLLGYFAGMAVGAIPVHLYAQKTHRFVALAAEHTAAALVLTDRDDLDPRALPCRLARISGLAAPVSGATSAPAGAALTARGFDAAELVGPEAAAAPERWPRERHGIAYMMFTSGTTGEPKAVMTTQENVLFVTRTLIGIPGMRTGDRDVVVLPLGSTGGLGHAHANLVLGNHALLLPYFFGAMDDADLGHLLDAIEAHDATGFLSTPGMLARLAERHREAFRRQARGLRYVLANVTPMRPELVQDLLELLPHTRFHTYYGLTEASRSVYQCFNDHPDRRSCAGRAAPGVEIALDRPDPLTGAGEVLIRGGNVMAGYWPPASPSGQAGRDRQEAQAGPTGERQARHAGQAGDRSEGCRPGNASAALSAGGWFRTGDLGSLDDAGFLTIRGRLKDIVNVDGLKCFPFEIEEVLARHPAVAECAVVGVPDRTLYERLAAAVVPRAGEDPAALPAELARHCRRELELYKVPQQFLCVDALPRSGLGKIDRQALAARLAEAWAR